MEVQFEPTAAAFAGFEVLPRSGSVHSAHGDERAAELLSLVTEISTEKGLDNQNYQCKGCGRNIGWCNYFFNKKSLIKNNCEVQDFDKIQS